MARRKTQEWGIAFGVTVNRDGYAWVSLPHAAAGRTGRVLVSASSWEGEGTSLTYHAATTVETRYGLEPVRSAYRAFGALARTLTMRLPEEVEVEVKGGRVRVRPPITDDAEAERLVVDYADRFGPLWGEDDLHTLKDWRKASAEFLAMQELGHALRDGTMVRLSDRFVSRGDRLVYLTGYEEIRYFVVTGDVDVIETRASANALPVLTDVAARTKGGSTSEKGQAALSRQLGTKLQGGTSIVFSATDMRVASVAPRHLIHALYLYLWLKDINGGRADERPRTCKECGGEIPNEIDGRRTTRAAEYCSKQCRWEFNNRRRAKSR